METIVSTHRLAHDDLESSHLCPNWDPWEIQLFCTLEIPLKHYVKFCDDEEEWNPVLERFEQDCCVYGETDGWCGDLEWWKSRTEYVTGALVLIGLCVVAAILLFAALLCLRCKVCLSKQRFSYFHFSSQRKLKLTKTVVFLAWLSIFVQPVPLVKWDHMPLYKICKMNVYMEIINALYWWWLWFIVYKIAGIIVVLLGNPISALNFRPAKVSILTSRCKK